MSLDELFVDGTLSDVRLKLVEELISEENLDRKTELNKPISWAALTILQELLERKKLPISTSIIASFTNKSFRYLISKDRKSRNEYVDALQSINVVNEENNQKLF